MEIIDYLEKFYNILYNNLIKKYKKEKYKSILIRAKSILLGEQMEDWDDLKVEIKPCANYIVEQIKKRMDILLTSDNTNKSITIS